MELAHLDIVRIPVWEEFPWLRHGFSTRTGGFSTVYSDAGDLNLGFTPDDDPERVLANREAFLRSVAIDDSAGLVAIRQVHGTAVKLVARGEPGLSTQDGRAVVEADGLMTAAPGAMLAVQAADCVPVLVADTRRRVVAAFHAGWRGTAAGIVEQGVAKIVAEFGSDPGDMVGAVGPSIGACCYAVGEEVRERFGARFSYAAEMFSEREDGLHVDLAEANRRQLLGAGLPDTAVVVVGECTACSRVEGRRKYFSHRAESGFTGRAMGMIGIAT